MQNKHCLALMYAELALYGTDICQISTIQQKYMPNQHYLAQIYAKLAKMAQKYAKLALFGTEIFQISTIHANSAQ